MIIKYTPVTDEYTTYSLIEPDYMMDETIRCTRLCELDGEVYVHVPDSLTLPGQHAQITVTEVTMTGDLKKLIKKNSHIIQYIDESVVEAIREKYSANDEWKLNRSERTSSEWIAYNDYCNTCISGGAIKKANYDL